MALTFKMSCLLTEEMSKQGYTHRIDFSYRGIAAGVANNTAATGNIAALPLATVIYRATLILVTPFEDQSDTAFNDNTVSLGDTGSATRFFSGVQVNKNGTEVLDSIYNTLYQYAAADTLILTLNSMSGKSISDLDKGQLMILLQVGNENRAQIIDAAQP